MLTNLINALNSANVTTKVNTAEKPVVETAKASPPEPAVVVKQSSTPTPEQVRQATEQINKVIQSMSRNLEFSFDDETNRTVVRVVDTETQEVIRQIPNEETLAIAKTLDHLQGILIRQKA